MTLKYTERTWLFKKGWHTAKKTKRVDDKTDAIKHKKRLMSTNTLTKIFENFELYDGDKLIKVL